MLTKSQIKEQVEQIREIHKLSEEAKKSLKDLTEYCLGIIKGKLLQVFPRSSFTIYENYLSHTKDGWSPSFGVVVKSGPNCFQSGAYFHYTTQGKFEWFSGHSHQVFDHDRVEGRSDPFDTSLLIRACEELEEELGVRVVLVETEVIKSPPYQYPINNDHIKLMYPGCKIITSGVIEYRGWDCTDRYCVFSHEGLKHLHYGTSGHGSGMTQHLVEGDDLSPFYDFMGDTYGESRVGIEAAWKGVLW